MVVSEGVLPGKRLPVQNRVRIKAVALPAEHGGWGFLFEPMILGLLVAPSVGGLFLSVAATAAFLWRHPFKLAMHNRRREQSSPRATLAMRFAIIYFAAAVLALALAIWFAGAAFLWALLLVAPFVIVQLSFDSLGRSRALLAELAGAISMGAVATSVAIAGDWRGPAAYGLWAIMLSRSVPTILYLRARLRRLHRKPASPTGAIISHVLAVLVVTGLAWLSVVPFLAMGALVILLLRALTGLARGARELTPKKLGLAEIGFGAMTVFSAAMGYAFGW